MARSRLYSSTLRNWTLRKTPMKKISRKEFVSIGASIAAMFGIHSFVRSVVVPPVKLSKKNKKRNGYRSAIKVDLASGFYLHHTKLYYVSSTNELYPMKGMDVKDVQAFQRKMTLLDVKEILKAKKYDVQLTEWMVEDFACSAWARENYDDCFTMLLKVITRLQSVMKDRQPPRTIFLFAGLINRYEKLHSSSNADILWQKTWRLTLENQADWKFAIQRWASSNVLYRWGNTKSSNRFIRWHQYKLF
jgi:hypothetical protein